MKSIYNKIDEQYSQSDEQYSQSDEQYSQSDEQYSQSKEDALYKEESNSFIDELKKNYHFDKILNKTLPEMIKNETREEVIEGLTKHLIFTNEHLLRLKEFFYSIGEFDIVAKHEKMYGKNQTEK